MSVSSLPRRVFVPKEGAGDQSFDDWLAQLAEIHAKRPFKGPAVLVCVDHEGDIAMSSTTGDLSKMGMFLDIGKACALDMALCGDEIDT